MISAGTGRAPLVFGDDALGFVRVELQAAAGDFDGPLAARLIGLELQAPFSFVSAEAETAARDWRCEGVDDGNSDRCLAIAVSRWLRQPDPMHQRLIALEEPIGRYADPAVDPRTLHFGERVYHAAHPGDRPDEVEHAFKQLTGYPGVGVISRPSVGAVSLGDVTDDALITMANAALAVLVRAWDYEAFLVAPVDGALAPEDLSCCGPGSIDLWRR